MSFFVRKLSILAPFLPLRNKLLWKLCFCCLPKRRSCVSVAVDRTIRCQKDEWNQEFWCVSVVNRGSQGGERAHILTISNMPKLCHHIAEWQRRTEPEVGKCCKICEWHAGEVVEYEEGTKWPISSTRQRQKFLTLRLYLDNGMWPMLKIIWYGNCMLLPLLAPMTLAASLCLSWPQSRPNLALLFWPCWPIKCDDQKSGGMNVW